jgi:TetR/AcrR family transcriptional regulator
MATDETRENLLRAATEVFVEKGFAGARVDEIARRARANKAAIYYHFQDKGSLYRVVLLRLMGPIHEHIDELAGGALGPRERLREFYAGIVRRFDEQPALPRVMIREILAGGRHMDRESAQAFSKILNFVSGALEEGRRAGLFRAVNPLFFHLAVLGPIFLLFISSTFRDRLVSVAVPDLVFPTSHDMLGHIDDVLSRSLDPIPARRS